jgi:hypothetical protein
MVTSRDVGSLPAEEMLTTVSAARQPESFFGGELRYNGWFANGATPLR